MEGGKGENARGHENGRLRRRQAGKGGGEGRGGGTRLGEVGGAMRMEGEGFKDEGWNCEGNLQGGRGRAWEASKMRAKRRPLRCKPPRPMAGLPRRVGASPRGHGRDHGHGHGRSHVRGHGRAHGRGHGRGHGITAVTAAVIQALALAEPSLVLFRQPSY